jgi:uncharacterized protein (DUF486 family)
MLENPNKSWYAFTKTFIVWLILNILVVALMDIALFSQTTPEMENTSIWNKILNAEFWATIEWFVLIPAQRIGNTFLNPAQLGLSSYVFNFLAQIVTNEYWLKVPTTLDDYAGMVVIMIGMVVSKMVLFG